MPNQQQSTLIIAEAGVNHNGDLAMARRLIDAAADAGADIVKFQTFDADRIVTSGAAKARYQVENTGNGESQQDMLRRLQLDKAAHLELIAHCELRNIRFLSTAFDVECADLLVSLGLTLFKIPSGEITNLPYLRHIGTLGGEVILSTGMANLAEVAEALQVLEGAGTQRKNITLLHCTTEYPTPMCDVNLRAMLTLQREFGTAIGYSDHTRGIEVSVAAVALGARVIEKHFTLDRNMPGPDHQASLEPAELRQMILSIRQIEVALGDGIKCAVAGELANIPMVRKSIVAKRAIKRGERFSPENLTSKRPGTGVSPMRWDEVVGTRAIRDFAADELIEI